MALRRVPRSATPRPLKHRVEEQVKRDVLGVLAQPLGVDGGLLQRGVVGTLHKNEKGLIQLHFSLPGVVP